VRHLLSIPVFCLAIMAFALPASAQSVTGNVNLFAGGKTLDDGDWAPTEKHSEVGVVADAGLDHWPVSLEVRFLSSESDTEFEPTLGLSLKLETTELDLGVRKTWGVGTNTHPYLSGGVAFIEADATVVNVLTANDDATGLWLGGGVYWVLAEHFNLGVDLMVSSAETNFGSGPDVNIGGVHLNFLAGFHF